MKQKLTSLIVALLLTVTAMAGSNKEPQSYNYQRGCEAIGNGNYDEGLKFLELELQDNPKNGYVWTWIHSAYAGQDEYGDAIDAGTIALKLLPKKEGGYRGFVHKSLAVIYYSLGENNLALAEISAAIKDDPDETLYLSMRGDIYYYSGLYELADADYETMISKSPGDVTGYMGIGRDLLAQKRYDEAMEYFDYSMKFDDEYSQPYAFRAECYIGKKDYRSAAQDIVKALDIDDNDKAYVMMQECNDTCYQNLVVFMNIKSSKSDNDREWDYYLGVVHQQHKHFADAIASYKKSLESNPKAITYQNIAECYAGLGNHASAHRYIDLAMELDSADVDFIREKADYYYSSGDTKAAIDIIGKYIESDPEFFYGYYRRGFYKDNIRDIDGAIEDYTYSITLEPRYTYAYLCRADMYTLKGDADAARVDYETVIELDTIIYEGGNCRQYAYQMLGQKDSADAWMQRILDEYPNEGNYYDAACLMSRMGEKARSIAYLRMAFENGYYEFNHMYLDDDLDLIREEPEFQELIKKYKAILDEKNLSAESDEIPYVELETTEVPFSRSGDMMMIQCTINNLPLHFIFDTGASAVSISDVEANFMLKNGYLKTDDIVGKAHFMTADGSISEGTVINLRNVNFGGLELTDVKASVVKSQQAPLLLGQSVFGRLGKIEIDNSSRVVKVTHSKKK